jgi:drug/metabolite transporter (DMT)-like permease
MMENYLLGVLLAICGGAINSLGVVLQKKVVNEIPREAREEKFMRTLVRNPIWIFGLICVVVFSAIFLLSSSAIIGGALVPGLSAIGLVVLVIGSIKIIGETLKKLEILAILILIIGIFFIGLSELSIAGRLDYFFNIDFNIRITIFTILLFILWMICRYFGKRREKGKTILLAFSAGLPFALGNVWMQPFTLSLTLVFGGNADFFELFIFIVSTLILVPTSFMGIIFVQEAFKYGDASKIVPIQQIPIQIAPVFLYFLVFLKYPPNVFSPYLIITGITFVLVSGFLLGKRQAAIEKIT